MTKLAAMTDDALVQRFEQIALAQFDAIRVDNNAKFNRLYRQMDEVDNELRDRGLEARRLLSRLYDHPNPQVRLKAAVRSLAIDPNGARAVLEAIKESREQPQALDAGMSLLNLDRGVFKPT
jgi:hypothetical protein